MTFKEAVKAAQHPVNGAYCPGKQAMKKKYRHLVTCTDSRRFTGSIDLDTALRKHRPSDNRRDYGLGYKQANGRENENTERLQQLSERADGDIRYRYVWIASGDRVAILKNSPQARQLAQSGLSLKKALPLP